MSTSEILSLGRATWPGEEKNWPDALRRHGELGAAAAADGSFAVGLTQDDGAAYLATDRFATQSLCWRADPAAPGGVRIAERADQLGTREIDPQALFDYLYGHHIASPRTIFRGVQRLPAAHVARVRQGEAELAPYWSPNFAVGEKRSYEQLKAEFRSLLRDAVASELDAGTPACFLSGGTDSSTVAGHIKQIAGRAVTFSIGFDAEGYDEMEYARIAARHFGCEHHEYYVTPDDLVAGIAHVAASYDQPFGNSSALPAYYCALRAREQGVSKLLAGDGGDELFGGNSRYATQRIYGWYGLVPGALRRGVLEPLLGTTAASRVPLVKKGASYVRDAKVPLPDRLQHYNLLRRLGIDEVLAPGFLAAVRQQAPLEHQREVWRQTQADNDIDRMLAFDWRFTLAECDLPKVIGTTRLAGITTGFPLLAQPLVDFALRLPADYKLRGLKLRWFFKEALRDFLPEAIINKPKKGFGLPFGVWATRHAALQTLASDSVRSVATRGIVRPEFTRRLLDEHLPQHPGYYGEMVWILMMLEQWLRHHAPDYRFEG